ncbi:MAG: tyrosine-type recombinase/integrase [Floccifex sp.]
MNKKNKNIREVLLSDGKTKKYRVEIRYIDIHGIKKRYSKTFDHLSEAKKDLAEKRVLFDVGFQNELHGYSYKVEPRKEIKLEKTYSVVLKEFLKNERNYSPNTMYNTKRYLEMLEPEFGSVDITQFNYAKLQGFFNERENEGIETNRNIKKALNRLFLYAAKSGYIADSPITFLKVTGVCNKRKSKDDLLVLSRDQFEQIIVECRKGHGNEAYPILFSLMYFAGMRPSEAASLTWNDVSFERNTIDINKKINYKGLSSDTLIVSSELKSQSAYAEIPMAKELREELLQWKEKNPFEWIIPNQNGNKPVNPEVAGNYFRKVVKRLGYKGVSLYTLRHSFISNLAENSDIESGMDLKVFGELCRHASINTSYKYYIHSKDNQKQDIIDKTFNKN